jgi:hypothetical protein
MKIILSALVMLALLAGITANAMACPKGTFKCKGYCQETCDLEK